VAPARLIVIAGNGPPACNAAELLTTGASVVAVLEGLSDPA
jgi:hypothetical protein